MNILKNFSCELANDPKKVFSYISDEFRYKKDLNAAISILNGFLTLSLPQYFLPTIKCYKEIVKNKENYRNMALTLLVEDADVLFGIISDSSVENDIRMKLISIVTKNILKAEPEPRTLLRYIATLISVFMLDNNNEIGILAYKSLCRLDADKILKISGIDNVNIKLSPYEEIYKWRKLNKDENDFSAIEYIFNYPIFASDSKVDYVDLCSGLPIENFMSVISCLEQKANNYLNQKINVNN